MLTYRRPRTSPFMWLLIMVIFILGLTVTFDEVSGVGNPSAPATSQENSTVESSNPSSEPAPPSDGSQESPNTVPEPTTIILLGGGLAGAYMLRRWKKN